MVRGKLLPTNTKISLVIPTDVKEQAATIATQDNRSLSNLIVNLLKDYIKIHDNPELALKYQQLLYEYNVLSTTQK